MVEVLVSETAALTELERLRESNALLRRYAGQAAHDLQEPLRELSGWLDLLVANLDGRGPPLDAAKLAREAKAAADRMGGLVESVLDHARAENAPLEPVACALDACLDEAMRSLGATLRDSGARVQRAAPLPTVHGDPTHLARMFRHLLSNAVKFARPGSAPAIEVTAQRAGAASWEILVVDHGVGLPEGEQAADLFRPFHRHDPAIPGTGLGLSAAKSIVERHGGRIWATPTPGGGATFHVLLPEGASP